MKNRASRFLKQIIADLSAMAKSKTLALRSRTNAIKARLIIFSLLINKKYVMSTLSEKFQSVLGHHSQSKEESLLEESSDRNEPVMLSKIIAHSYEATSHPNEIQVVVEDKDMDRYESCYRDEEDDDCSGGNKYSDHTQSLFDSEELDHGGSILDLVKDSNEEAGQDFRMENEIDRMADLFIKKFHRQILLQKQESLKRCQEMLLNGGA